MRDSNGLLASLGAKEREDIETELRLCFGDLGDTLRALSEDVRNIELFVNDTLYGFNS